MRAVAVQEVKAGFFFFFPPHAQNAIRTNRRVLNFSDDGCPLTDVPTIKKRFFFFFFFYVLIKPRVRPPFVRRIVFKRKKIIIIKTLTAFMSTDPDSFENYINNVRTAFQYSFRVKYPILRAIIARRTYTVTL